tara:strand:+ start:199 stop:609 length:411 start_codon:yes stop_codon:yes gene_type:complete
MKKMFLIAALALGFALTSNAQEKGDWYVGSGDVANIAWTEWSVSPTVGYGVTDNIMLSVAVSQADSTADMNLDFTARYFFKGYFAYVATSGLSTDDMDLGIGKMFTIRNNVFVDPKIVYSSADKTTNLMLGFGLKF